MNNIKRDPKIWDSFLLFRYLQRCIHETLSESIPTNRTKIMSKFNTFSLVALMSLGAFLNVSCDKEEAIETASHHVGLYAMSKDLMEIYDVKVEALCDGKVVNSVNLNKANAFSEDDNRISFNVDTYTSDSVEYKLTLTCNKELDELEPDETFALGYATRFVSVERSPEKAAIILDKQADFSRATQTFSTLDLKSVYNDKSIYKGLSVYAVYAIVNSETNKDSNEKLEL